jgi:hypothetical protein
VLIDVAQRQDRRASPRAIAVYLLDARAVLVVALEARQHWIRRLGELIEDAHRGNAGAVATGARRLGEEFGPRFRESRAVLGRSVPPPPCAACHRQLIGWLDALSEGCDVLREVGQSGTLRDLRRAQAAFGVSRRHARGFNQEYARLVVDLRRRVTEAVDRRRRRRGGYA